MCSTRCFLHLSVPTPYTRNRELKQVHCMCCSSLKARSHLRDAQVHATISESGTSLSIVIQYMIVWIDYVIPMMRKKVIKVRIWSYHHHKNIPTVYNFDPTFIQYNWGLQGYTLFFLFLHKNYVLSRKKNQYQNFYLKFSVFCGETFNIFE